MNPTRAGAVIFDMDGLLIDSERPVRDAWFQAMHELNLSWNEPMYLEMVGRDHRDSRALCLENFGDQFPYDQICARVRVILDHRLGTRGYDLKPGALEILDFLAQHSTPCAVASSTVIERVRRRLDQAGVLKFMRAVSGGDEVSRGKPAPDLFLLTAKKLGVSPSDCLVLEDSPSGARGAHDAGMAVILVPDIKPPPDDVRQLALGVFSSLPACRPAIETWLRVG